ncbi:Killer toxin subunits alpha/beta 5 [Colletotrichum truncatum]|uniref:Killer toxin subunits alpha/beta 5 n=1 Tax=Colletotrichum truncatum TaxID=5467 RepID=A0ACC3ZGL5_COLTU|nr:Killer toxin subunits alpha/beta 5 [Colletotrichum truncatum]KAF6784733.1 Killer toxin subunits alpha/beta 5 [Colletotrichum truncatum]
MRGQDRYSLPSLTGVLGILFPCVVATLSLSDRCSENCLVSGPNPSNWTVDVEVGQLLEQSTTCNKTRRTGNWVKKECTSHEVAGTLDFEPQKRWEALECQAAWDDAIQVWIGCYRDNLESSFKFMQFMADFLHQNDDQMISNYYHSLRYLADHLAYRKDIVVGTFAPKLKDGTDLFGLFLTLIQFPFGLSGARFFGNSFLGRDFFAGNVTGHKKAAWETATMSLVNTSFEVAQEILERTEETRSEISFDALSNGLSKSWMKQSDRLIQKLFDGSEKSIELLSNLFKDGKMMAGMPDGPGLPQNGNSDGFNRESATKRALYAVAIPAIWAANGPTPVVVDFGPSCEIDARKYFTENASKYNLGWRCVNGHSYILAGVADKPPRPCGTSVPDNECTVQSQWTLKILDGIKYIQKPSLSWGGITVDDLIIGAVSTYERNGRKNRLNIKDNLPSPSDKAVFESYKEIELDVRTPGYVLIPVCGPEEARANLAKGRQRYGNSNNYPCNP